MGGTQKTARCLFGAVVAMIAVVSTAAAQVPEIQFAFVPADDVQPGGPSYDYRIGRLEIRNDQFVAFLNDAMANLANGRGHFHSSTM